MLGLMQDWPLLCHRIIEHAASIHGTQEVVTRSVEGPIHRTTYAEIRDRALKVSQRLDRAREFTRNARALGITVHGTFILGLPGETRETIDATIRDPSGEIASD